MKKKTTGIDSCVKEIRKEYDYKEFAKNRQFCKVWDNESDYKYGWYSTHYPDEEWSHEVSSFKNQNFLQFYKNVKPMKEPEECDDL